MKQLILEDEGFSVLTRNNFCDSVGLDKSGWIKKKNHQEAKKGASYTWHDSRETGKQWSAML
jgi:hypothetical protein